MPAVTAADEATLKMFPQSGRVGMVIYQPATIVSGTVSAATGATSLTLSGMVTVEEPDAHFTVYAGSAAGLSDGGKVRLRSKSSNVLTVAPNWIEWGTYSYVTVKKVVEPWPILPDLGNDYEDTNVPYSDQNYNYHPLGRIGPPGIATTNEAYKFLSASVAYNSRIWDGTPSSHAWTFPSGSPGSSSSAGSEASPIEVTWSTATGMEAHYIKYVVTDSNGKTHTRYNPIWVLDSFDDSYCDVTVESCSGDFSGGGWQASLKVWGDADIAEFPEDAMVVLFAEDYYGGHKTSIGGNWPYREDVFFVGWIARDTITRDIDLGFVMFDVVGPALKMKELLCWPANLEYVSRTGDTTWHNLFAMTCDSAAFHILTEHTTMDLICDFYLTGTAALGAARLMRFIDIPEADPYTQIDDYCATPIGARLLSNKQGQLFMEQNPNLMPVANRSGIATIIGMDINDPIRNDPGLEIAEEDQQWQVSQVDFAGFGYDGADARPWYALAPGVQYEEGSIDKVDSVRVDTQAEANAYAGLYLANLNNIFREIRIPLFNWRIFDIAPQEYTTLTLAAADTKRGLVWSAQKIICREVEIEYDVEDGTLLVNPTFEKDSFGPAGITGDYPSEPPNTPWDWPQPAPPEWPVDEPYAPQSLFVGDDTNGWFFILAGTETWIERNTGPTVVGVKQAGWDPWWFTAECAGTTNPEQAVVWRLGVGAIYRSTDNGQTWEDVTPTTDPSDDYGQSPAPTSTTVTYSQRVDSIHTNKLHMISVNYDDGSIKGCWLLYTEDDGDSWNWVSLQGFGGSYFDGTYAYAFAHMLNNSRYFAEGRTTRTAGNLSDATGEADDSGYTITFTIEDTGASMRSMWLFIDMGAQIDTATALDIRSKLTDTSNWINNVGIRATNSDAYWATIISDGEDGTFTDQASWTNIGSSLTDWLGATGTSYGWHNVHTASLGNYRYWAIGGEQHMGDNDDLFLDAFRIACDGYIGDGPGMSKGWILGMDFDSEEGRYLYLTVWTGSALALWVLDKEGPVSGTPFGDQVVTNALGSCSEADLDAETYYAFPYTPTFDKSICYVHGLTADGYQLIRYDVDVVTPAIVETVVESGLGTSGVTTFRAEGEVDGSRTFYGSVSDPAAVPKFYSGGEGLSYLSDLPGNSGDLINFDAMSVSVRDSVYIAIGFPSAAAGVMIVESDDGGATWNNATNNLPIDGIINSVEYV